MGLSDNFLLRHQVSVGKRYVFFSSLPGPAGLEPYQKVKEIGEQYLKKATKQLNPRNIKSNKQFISTLQGYVTMIGKLAERERNNEIEFVSRFKEILSSDKLKTLPKEFYNMVNNLEKNFDYIKLIALINKMLEKNQDYEEQSDKIIINNMKLFSTNYENMSEQTIQEIKDAYYKESYGKFIAIGKNTLMRDILNTADETRQHFITMASSLFARKFNSVFYNIVNDKKIIETINNCWINNWDASTIKKVTVAVVVNYLSELNYETLVNKTGKELAQNISQCYSTLTKNVDIEYAENMLNLVTGKAVKTLEEIALTSRKGLGKMFLSLEREEQKNVLKMYRNYELHLTMEEIETGLKKNQKQKEALITKRLGNAIRKRAQQEFGKEFNARSGDAYKQQVNFVDLLKKSAPDFFQRRKLSEKIENILQITINGPSAAEYFAGDRFKNAITQAIVYTPGKTIQLKTDASVTFSYTPIEFNEDEINLEQQLTPILKNWGELFLQRYKNSSLGTTSVEIAEETFKTMMQDTSELIINETNKLKNANEEQKRILQSLNDFVNASISVKEYTYGTNELGFTGGSLGPNSAMALDNIYKMYELGGINGVDIDTLYFVLANCGPDGIANGLKENLENYLIGGAAMMMFDDGFANANAYIQKMIAQFGFMPKLLHLYMIQGRYIPASLVYTSIYNSLLQVYSDIVKRIAITFDTGSINNTITITNTIQESNYNWDYQHYPYNYAQNRFNKVRDDATPNIDIRFSFLAGILDIFEGISKAFNNI